MANGELGEETERRLPGCSALMGQASDFSPEHSKPLCQYSIDVSQTLDLGPTQTLAPSLSCSRVPCLCLCLWLSVSRSRARLPDQRATHLNLIIFSNAARSAVIGPTRAIKFANHDDCLEFVCLLLTIHGVGTFGFYRRCPC